jgi:hypothetical protein
LFVLQNPDGPLGTLLNLSYALAHGKPFGFLSAIALKGDPHQGL